MSLMSGVSPYVHRVGLGPKPFEGTYYPGHLPTLAQLLHENGYSTKALIGNPTIDVAQNVREGFDEYIFYERLPAGRTRGSEWLARSYPLRYATGGNTPALTRESLDWIEANRHNRFFLWVHYLDPHWTYAPPPKYLPVTEEIVRRWTREITQEEAYSGRRFSDELQSEARALYRGEVKFMDDNVGEVIEGLKSLGVYDDALVVLTSDHGEEFWDHGHFGHGHSMHADTLNVPFLVKLPNSTVTGEVEEPVSTQSLVPTIVDLLQIESEGHPAWSPSLKPFLSETQPAPSAGSPVFSTGTYRFEDMEMVIFGGVKVIHRIQSEEWLAFDLRNDPGELTNRAKSDLAGAVAKASQLLKDYRMQAEEARGEVENQKASDPAVIERLKSLGYAR
jgi:arylsulfatase A-like enzyme